MFAETSFDDGAESSPPVPVLPTEETEAPATHTLHFHRPGDADFSSVAGSRNGKGAPFDNQTINGDSWVSSECRCTRCECLRVLSNIDCLRSRQSKGETVILVLLDLDNFGFNQFKSIPPHMDVDNTDVDILDYIYMWGFFGSCFSRYYKTWPNSETVCEALPQQRSVMKQKPSIWQRLVSSGRVHFTPCGGHSQGADEVMLDVIKVFADMNAILVTSDVKLLQKVYQKRRLLGMKTRRSNEDDMLADRLTLVNVEDLDKRFVPVWRELVYRVTQCVKQARGEEHIADRPVMKVTRRLVRPDAVNDEEIDTPHGENANDKP